jgi:hypothetical protein
VDKVLILEYVKEANILIGQVIIGFQRKDGDMAQKWGCPDRKKSW